MYMFSFLQRFIQIIILLSKKKNISTILINKVI